MQLIFKWQAIVKVRIVRISRYFYKKKEFHTEAFYDLKVTEIRLCYKHFHSSQQFCTIPMKIADFIADKTLHTWFPNKLNAWNLKHHARLSSTFFVLWCIMFPEGYGHMQIKFILGPLLLFIRGEVARWYVRKIQSEILELYRDWLMPSFVLINCWR